MCVHAKFIGYNQIKCVSLKLMHGCEHSDKFPHNNYLNLILKMRFLSLSSSSGSSETDDQLCGQAELPRQYDGG